MMMQRYSVAIVSKKKKMGKKVKNKQSITCNQLDNICSGQCYMYVKYLVFSSPEPKAHKVSL